MWFPSPVLVPVLRCFWPDRAALLYSRGLCKGGSETFLKSVVFPPVSRDPLTCGGLTLGGGVLGTSTLAPARAATYLEPGLPGRRDRCLSWGGRGGPGCAAGAEPAARGAGRTLAQRALEGSQGRPSAPPRQRAMRTEPVTRWAGLLGSRGAGAAAHRQLGLPHPQPAPSAVLGATASW